MTYLLLKALHVVSIISWMAALLYLPRLFVYHAQEPVASPQSELLKLMEKRLYRYIMTPAMVFSWITGLYLAIKGFDFKGGWLHAKLLFVVAMSAHHGLQGRFLRQFSQDQRLHSHKLYRVHNEVPTVLMILIIVMVIVKPF